MLLSESLLKAIKIPKFFCCIKLCVKNKNNLYFYHKCKSNIKYTLLVPFTYSRPKSIVIYQEFQKNYPPKCDLKINN